MSILVDYRCPPWRTCFVYFDKAHQMDADLCDLARSDPHWRLSISLWRWKYDQEYLPEEFNKKSIRCVTTPIKRFNKRLMKQKKRR